MPFDAQSGERLREERQRLARTQQEMADVANVRREMWSKYERGVAVPGGDVFEALARHGFNVLYVLTGVAGGQPPTPEIEPLTRREQALLANYRGSSEEGKRAVESTASALSHGCGSKKKDKKKGGK